LGLETRRKSRRTEKDDKDMEERNSEDRNREDRKKRDKTEGIKTGRNKRWEAQSHAGKTRENETNRTEKEGRQN